MSYMFMGLILGPINQLHLPKMNAMGTKHQDLNVSVGISQNMSVCIYIVHCIYERLQHILKLTGFLEILLELLM